MGFPAARPGTRACLASARWRDASGSARKLGRSAHDALGSRGDKSKVSRSRLRFREKAVVAAHLPAPRGRGRDRHPHGPRRRGLSGRRLGRAPDRRAIEPDRPRTQRPRADPPTLAPFWSLTPDKARRHHDNGCFGRQLFILPGKQSRHSPLRNAKDVNTARCFSLLGHRAAAGKPTAHSPAGFMGHDRERPGVGEAAHTLTVEGARIVVLGANALSCLRGLGLPCLGLPWPAP